jgi:hypothetical protein
MRKRRVATLPEFLTDAEARRCDADARDAHMGGVRVVAPTPPLSQWWVPMVLLGAMFAVMGLW